MALPAKLIINEEEEYLEVFENEYREVMPNIFFPFGFLYEGTEVILYNSSKDTIHIFNIAHIVDTNRIKDMLEHPVYSFNNFIKLLNHKLLLAL